MQDISDVSEIIRKKGIDFDSLFLLENSLYKCHIFEIL